VKQAAVFFAIVAGVLAASASGETAGLPSFRTPSGNIGCIYFPAQPGLRASLRCDIRSGLRPQPARPRRCHLDYGDSYELPRTGRVIVVCHGDTTLDPHAPVLAYGNMWRRNGLTCISRSTGLRCANAGGHGFFMSRAHSYRF
jgi:Family of unknown function (DUF6636)